MGQQDHVSFGTSEIEQHNLTQPRTCEKNGMGPKFGNPVVRHHVPPLTVGHMAFWTSSIGGL